MEPSVMGRERFCKDCAIPIKIFEEPYFTDRLSLFDTFYGTCEKWHIFTEECAKYQHEQDYFEEYQRIKDCAILDIKTSAAFQAFETEDMNQYQIAHNTLPGRDIFKVSNHGKSFISIDMRKANFSSLYHYSPEIFANQQSWEAFIGNYTDNRHIIHSKYIRQVILGNCSPKRHITYEKYLMDQVLTALLETSIDIERIVSFSNDEIVADVSDLKSSSQQKLAEQICVLTGTMSVPLRTELFVLWHITGTNGYYKKLHYGGQTPFIEFKCLDNYMLPFVIRKFLGEQITENDKVFCYEGMLAKFIDTPKIVLS